jgi:hypothetical protein
VINDPPPREPFNLLGSIKLFLIEMAYPIAGLILAASLALMAFAIAAGL